MIPANKRSLLTGSCSRFGNSASAPCSMVLLNFDSVAVQTCVEVDCFKVVPEKTLSKQQINSEAVVLAVTPFYLQQESLNPIRKSIYF